MGIRSRRAAAKTEARMFYGHPKGSNIPSSKVYSGAGTVPSIPDIRVTAKPRVGNDWKPWHEARAIYREGTTTKAIHGTRKVSAPPIRSARVGVITYGSGYETVGNID